MACGLATSRPRPRNFAPVRFDRTSGRPTCHAPTSGAASKGDVRERNGAGAVQRIACRSRIISVWTNKLLKAGWVASAAASAMTTSA